MRPSEQSVIDHAVAHRNRWLPNVPIYDEVPDGWHVVKGTTTQPRGCVWIANGAPFVHDGEGWHFNHKLKSALTWDERYC